MARVEKINHVKGIEDIKSDDLTLNEVKRKGLALHQVFENDTHATADEKTREHSPSFLKKMSSRLLAFQDTKAPAAAPVEKTEEIQLIATKPISPVPVLEKPVDFEEDEKTISLFNHNIQNDTTEKLREKKLIEGAALISNMTMEQIAALVFKAQLENEKDRAITTQDTLTKLHDIRKILRQNIEKVKDLLIQDEKVMGYFKTAQNITQVANLICAVFAIIVVTSPLIVIGTCITAVLTALSIGGKSYYETKQNENQATMTKSNHQDKVFEDKIRTKHEDILNIADADTVFSEHLMKLVKNRDRAGQAINQN